MEIEIVQVDDLAATDFIDVLRRSGLAARRPVEDQARITRMLENSNLIIVAREQDTRRLVGVARSVTDFAYCCYLSDLAVDRAHQGRGLGRRLIERTREAAGQDCMCLLLSAPDAMGFYGALGVAQPDNAFLYPRER